MTKSDAQEWLNRLYKVRDFLVGWYFKHKHSGRKLLTYQKVTKTPLQVWLQWILNMDYIFDAPVHYVQSPQETWYKKGGDCEDQAWFCMDQLRRAGYHDSYCFRVRWEDKHPEFGHNGHVVTIWDRCENTFRYMGTGLHEYSLKHYSPRELALKIAGKQKIKHYGYGYYKPDKSFVWIFKEEA